MKNKLLPLIEIVLIIIIPIFSFSQAPDPGPGSEAVPFDDNMNLIFLLSGIAFAVVITVKNLRKKTVEIK
jgi:hypothetical protein